MKETTKDETFWAVLNSAIELEFLRGHQRWTMSELSRSSKVTRSLIYYYFGKSKEGLLQEAVKLIGEEFLGLTPARVDLWKRGELTASILLSRRLMERAPHVGSFYMVHRRAETSIGESIRQLEKEFWQKIKRFFADKSDANHEALHALLIGLVMTPTISDDGVKKAVQAVATLSKTSLK